MRGNNIIKVKAIIASNVAFALCANVVVAQQNNKQEERNDLALISKKQDLYYSREVIPTPKDVVLEAGGIAILPDKKVAVSSRRGDIWVCSGAYDEDLSKVTWKRYATGVHEPLGIFYRDGSVYATTRSEIKKMTDLDGDGVADSYLTINDSWGTSGNYHEYNFGSSPDKEGNIWVVHCLTGSGSAKSDFRGWAFRYSLDGKKSIPTCAGIRSPGGIGFNASGDCFYTDNQGFWNGSSSLKWLKPGSFQGNPTGNKYAKKVGFPEQPTPNDDSTRQIEYDRDNRIQRPAVILPHGLVGQSPTGIITDETAGKFGPFSGQLLVGDQTNSEVQRVFLEKVKGQYQGAAWKMLEGFQSGIVPLKMGEAGTLFTGGTNRGWSSKGIKPFSFERVRWTGKEPFEMKEVKVTKDGFIISFTDELKDGEAGDIQSYSMNAWTYQYRSKYGSRGIVDEYVPKVTQVTIAQDKKSVRIVVDKLTLGHVHHIKISDKVVSVKDMPIWHNDVYYTLNEIGSE